MWRQNKNMAMELKYGETALCTKDIGRMIKLTVGDDSFTPLETLMRASG